MNKGKQFEERFRNDWKLSFPNGTIDRIYDTMNGYKAISNVCDFLGYDYPNIFYLECKTHAGASLPFVNITQYEKLKYKVGITGVRTGVVLWLYDKDLVLYIPISTITAMKEKGLKSVGVKALDDGWNIKVIPSEKVRVFMHSDYSVLKDLVDGE